MHLRSHLPLAALGERVESRLKKLQTFLVCLKTGGADRKRSLHVHKREGGLLDKTVEHFLFTVMFITSFFCTCTDTASNTVLDI